MTGIAAQVSLYPLRQATLSPAIEEVVRIFREHGLEVEPGAMSTIISGDDEAVFAALREAFRSVAAQGQVVMIVTFSNACPVPNRPTESIVGHRQMALGPDQPEGCGGGNRLSATVPAPTCGPLAPRQLRLESRSLPAGLRRDL